jgi:hypothetical protein
MKTTFAMGRNVMEDKPRYRAYSHRAHTQWCPIIEATTEAA